MPLLAPVRLLDGDLEIRPHQGFLEVWHRRAAKDVAEMDFIIDAIESALDSHGVRRLMFDSRESEYTPSEVQQRIWEWLQAGKGFERVATLVEAELLAVSVRMTGMGKGVKIKAFADRAEARQWLVE
jgi:hypothetical protein